MQRFFALVGFVAWVMLGVAACGSRTGLGVAGGVGGEGGSGGASAPGCGRCPAAITCAGKGLDCGEVGDGCGCLLDCGSCAGLGQTCGGSGVPNVCGTACTPSTCAALGAECGMIGDGCDGTLDCGACPGGQTCGDLMPNTCGVGNACQTCAAQGFDCGMEGDGCGTAIACGTCPANTVCGEQQPGVCAGVSCVPKGCVEQGFDCGMATDTCGGIIDCGTCAGNQICGDKGPNACGLSGACTNLCLQQVTCAPGTTTSVTGTVFAPQGTDPLYGVLVYVPNAPVLPFTPGVVCGDCSAQVSGAPLVSAVTGVDGTFTINNVPAGPDIPIVIQNGRWRRQFVIPNVAPCVSTALPTAGMPQIRMPQTHTEGDIPLMAFVTGYADALECVLRKIGIADSEFSDPSGSGRVRLYQGVGMGGAVYSANTPTEDQLWGTQAAVDQYDMVYFACQGHQYEQTPEAQQTIINYANAGGRIFATHWSFVWLYDDPPFSTTADWDVAQTQVFTNDPGTGLINTTFPKGLALAQWLQVIYPASTLGQIPLAVLRHDFDGVVPPSLLWITVDDASYPAPVPMHYTFDTPVGLPSTQQCGRVLYDDFHVEDIMETGAIFPAECTNPVMTPQEKLLEFTIFDLGACVDLKVCSKATTCAEQNITCGPTGDGCGNILQCGTCPPGLLCIDGTCGGACQPRTCQSQGFTCGQQGDGCGGILDCGGPCPPNEVCLDGTCQVGPCPPQSCAGQGFSCGPQGDGCGAILQCGPCAANQQCIKGVCTTPSCTPKSCADQGYDCGLATDGCNTVIDCGTCTAPQICGGSKANVCGAF